MLRSFGRCVPALAAFTLLFSAAQASDLSWKNIQFGGFASQGYLLSSANDYLGDTSEGTFDFREYAANASWSAGKWRIGAQVFGQKLGAYGNDEIKLDWASIDYQPAQWFGVRAGRVKMPRGLYNESLDLDSTRPFVLLPQSVYDARLRDFQASFDGGMIYGNIPLRKLGSVDYRAFYGRMPLKLGSGANDYFNNDVPYPNIRIGLDSVRGGTVFWNTPANGLRVGYSYSAFENLAADRRLYIPIGPGIPPIELILFKSAHIYERHLVSAEYTKGAWTFAGELGHEHAIYGIGIPGEAALPGANLRADSDYYYLAASRRINRWLELGAYYSYSVDNEVVESGTIIVPDFLQRDWALSSRFDINDHLVFKLEGHVMHGAGKIFDTPEHPQPFAARDNSWTMLAAKVTYSF